jgi:hypothetical protein
MERFQQRAIGGLIVISAMLAGGLVTALLRLIKVI